MLGMCDVWCPHDGSRFCQHGIMVADGGGGAMDTESKQLAHHMDTWALGMWTLGMSHGHTTWTYHTSHGHRWEHHKRREGAWKHHMDTHGHNTSTQNIDMDTHTKAHHMDT